MNLCMYLFNHGSCASCSWAENSEAAGGDSTWNDARVPRDSILGMLLDLEEGTLTIYQDNQRLGVMKSGLAGEYCWGVFMNGANTVSITRGKVPAD